MPLLPWRALLVESVRAALAAMAAAVGGCVIPLAPEFESERNVPPFIKLADPELGTTVTDRNQTFRVMVEDANRADNLYVAWLIDYPPYLPNITRVGQRNEVPSEGPDNPNEHELKFLPSCELISPSRTQHTLMLAVSDRPFQPTMVGGVELLLDRTAPDAHAVRAVWNFEKECQ